MSFIRLNNGRVIDTSSGNEKEVLLKLLVDLTNKLGRKPSFEEVSKNPEMPEIKNIYGQKFESFDSAVAQAYSMSEPAKRDREAKEKIIKVIKPICTNHDDDISWINEASLKEKGLSIPDINRAFGGIRQLKDDLKRRIWLEKKNRKSRPLTSPLADLINVVVKPWPEPEPTKVEPAPAEPEPVLEPVPEPAPEPVTEPEESASAEPEPVVEPEPVAEPEPVIQPEPAPAEPEPAPAEPESELKLAGRAKEEIKEAIKNYLELSKKKGYLIGQKELMRIKNNNDANMTLPSWNTLELHLGNHHGWSEKYGLPYGFKEALALGIVEAPKRAPKKPAEPETTKVEPAPEPVAEPEPVVEPEPAPAEPEPVIQPEPAPVEPEPTALVVTTEPVAPSASATEPTSSVPSAVEMVNIPIEIKVPKGLKVNINISFTTP